MNSKLPHNIYFVHFTNNLKNINPCRFNDYDDACNYAKKYDKYLINTVIDEYDLVHSIYNGGRLPTYLLINKILRKIFLYGKKHNNHLVYNYNIDIDSSISLNACIYLYTNVFFNITAKIGIDFYKKYTIKDDILKYFRSPYNTYINTSGIIFNRYKNKQNKIISELFDARCDNDIQNCGIPAAFQTELPFVKECSINIETFFIDSNNRISSNDNLYYSISHNTKDDYTIPIVFNDIRKLISKLSWRYNRGCEYYDPSFLNIIRSGKNERVYQYPIKYNNVNDFLNGFLSDKNIY